MASGLKYKRQEVSTLSIKGILNDTADEITYEDENGNEQTISVNQVMSNFASMPVDFSVKQKAEEDLELVDVVDEED